MALATRDLARTRADRAVVVATVDNAASNAISRALGYEENGTIWATRRGALCQLARWTLRADAWEATKRHDIALSGVAECLPLLGLR